MGVCIIWVIGKKSWIVYTDKIIKLKLHYQITLTPTFVFCCVMKANGIFHFHTRSDKGFPTSSVLDASALDWCRLQLYRLSSCCFTGEGIVSQKKIQNRAGVCGWKTWIRFVLKVIQLSWPIGFWNIWTLWKNNIIMLCQCWQLDIQWFIVI